MATTQAAPSSSIATLDMEELRKTLDREEQRKTKKKNNRSRSSMSAEFVDSESLTTEKANKTHKLHRNGWKVSWRWAKTRKEINKGKALTSNDHKLDQNKMRSHSKKECSSRQQGLSNKYQPKVFEDIVGHEITIKAISCAAKQRKVSHLYLFHGPGGTGKMSTARMFSMALNCESTELTKPCWSCSGCSRSVYIMELCSGSKITGFQRINTLLQTTSFTRTVQGYKVLIVEECHLLTTQAWDELLEVVERRYGSSVIFVLITEDTNMVPGKIVSQCQKFYFPKLKDSDITSKLVRIAAEEEIVIEREALRLVSAKAKGSLREAESILDQLSLLGPRISTSMVQQIVGLVPESKLADFIVAAVSGDVKKTLRLTKEQIANGIEPQALVSQLASLITEILSNAAVAVSDTDSSLIAGSSPSQDSQLSNTHLEQLCCALKILVDMEKQSTVNQNALAFSTLLSIASLDVPDKTTNSDNKSNTDSIATHQSRSFHSGSRSSRTPKQQNIERNNLSRSKSTEERSRCRGKGVDRGEPSKVGMGEVEEIWLNILQRVRNGHMKEFLCNKVKLASLTVSRDNAIVHLMFKKPEDKIAAQISEESIAKVLKKAIGYNVTVNMSLEPHDMEIRERHECVQSPNPQAKMQKHYKHHKQSPQPDSETLRSKEAPWSQQMIHLAGFLTEENQLDPCEEPRRTKHTARTKAPRHRWVSLSSIQQSDASVERYSQDILFDGGVRKHMKLHTSLSKACEDSNGAAQGNAKTLGLYRSWSCKDMLCQRKIKITNHGS